ncbi:MAG: ABC transporter ATP-binding protein [Acidimicrobiia bacterium]|nr:ABC transporter ATP-binding protein [Acidimicrobiia bacterium]
MTHPACQITSITKRFGSTLALDRVDAVVDGGVTGLLGPNGAGKTTLLRIVATVLTPDAGSLTLLGHDPGNARQRVEIRRRLGYMPQEPGFHRNFTVFEFIDYVAILKELTHRKTRHQEVRRVIDVVELGPNAHKKIRALSGGMRRRVALAQSLIADPQLLILDEPTAGLDPEQRLRFRDMISQLAEDRTVLLSSHQTDDIAALCNTVLVMDRGRVAFRGTPRQLTDTAAGHVWISDRRDPTARVAWRTGEGHHRHIGNAPPSATTIEPTIEDGYLLLIGEVAV